MGKTAKKACKKPYTKDDLERCLSDINNGMSVRKACFYHRIPRSTVKFRLGKDYKGQGRPGPPTALEAQEEDTLAAWIKKMARKGFPVTRYRVMSVVNKFLDRNPESGNFKSGKPTSQWFLGFMKRHPDLAVRTPEAVTKASANVTEKDIRNWFAEVFTLLEEEGLIVFLRKPKSIINGDESNFFLDPAVDKVIALRGEKNVYLVEQGPAKKTVTVMFTCSADGKMYPPMVVFPYKKTPPEVIQSVPAEWGIGKTDSGWMTTVCFLKYIKNILHPQLKKEDALPALYFIDGHSSHTAWKTAEECRKLDIHLICLYPNCTRILQPLDVAIFKPLKTSWLKTVDDWKVQNGQKYLKTENFAPLLSKALDVVTSELVTKAFECCGLYPFDVDRVDYSKCLGRNPRRPEDEVERGETSSKPHLEGNPSPSVERQDELNRTGVLSRGAKCSTAAEAGSASNGTIPVSREKAEEILSLMGPELRGKFMNRHENDFDSLEDLILARVFNLLEPLSSNFKDNLETANGLGSNEEILEEYLIEGLGVQGDLDGDGKLDSTGEIIAEFLLDEPGEFSPGGLKIEVLSADKQDKPDNINPSDQEHSPSDEDLYIPPMKDKKNTSGIAEFLDSPETPHRKGKINYKRRSPAVLTARRRLLYHKAVEEDKKRQMEEKQRKADERKKKQAEKLLTKKPPKPKKG